MTAHDIRQEARQLLKNLIGKYKLFLFPLLATFFSSSIQVRQTVLYQTNPEAEAAISSSFSYNIFSQLWTFILSILFTSAAYTLLEAYRKQRTEASYTDSLRGFSSPYLFKLFLLHLAEGLLLLPWIALLLLPLISYTVALYLYSGTNTFDPNSLAWLIIPALIGFVILMIKSYAYSQTSFILFDRIKEGKDTNPFDIIKESVQLMQGKKFDFFILKLSFLGWLLLIPLTLGLAGIYVIPYVWAADTVFYAQLKQASIN